MTVKPPDKPDRLFAQGFANRKKPGPLAWLRHPNWSPRTVALFGGAMVLVGAFLTVVLTGMFSPPRYIPATIYQGKNGSEPQTISELTKESKTCDEAIRTLLLAFANEVQGPDPNVPTDAVQKTRALVDTELAIVPTACQKLIDPISVQSVRDLRVVVQSVKFRRPMLTATMSIENVGESPVSVGYEDMYSRKNVRVSDNTSGKEYEFTDVAGVYMCGGECRDDDFLKFTRIEPGAKASVTIQSPMFYSAMSTPSKASVSLTLLTAVDGHIGETISFGFYDVPIE